MAWAPAGSTGFCTPCRLPRDEPVRHSPPPRRRRPAAHRVCNSRPKARKPEVSRQIFFLPRDDLTGTIATTNQAAFFTRPERRQLVQTRIRLRAPLTSARTRRRFGFQRRRRVLLAWLITFP